MDNAELASDTQGLSRVSVTSAEAPAEKQSIAGATGDDLAEAEATVAAVAGSSEATPQEAAQVTGAPAVEKPTTTAEPVSLVQPADAATLEDGGNQAGVLLLLFCT